MGVRGNLLGIVCELSSTVLAFIPLFIPLKALLDEPCVRFSAYRARIWTCFLEFFVQLQILYYLRGYLLNLV